MTDYSDAIPPAAVAKEFTMPAVLDAVTEVIPDRELVVVGDRRYTFAQIRERSNRLAAFLHSKGLGSRGERKALDVAAVGQDLLGIYAYSGNEYVESMLGAFRARLAPFNVNYRYVKAELAYLLADSGATALVYHAAFAPALAEVLPDLPHVRLLIQIADESGNALLGGAFDYESVVGSGSALPPPVTPAPDDLYVLYTGGTTGMPKGVLWRQHDIFMAAFGGRNLYTGTSVASIEAVAAAAAGTGLRVMVLPPLIHGAPQWAAMCAVTLGQTMVFPSNPQRFDAAEAVRVIEREKVMVVSVVGDAMALPLAAAMETGEAELSSLAVVGSGGGRLTAATKQRLIDARPGLMVLDGVGSSETGSQLTHISTSGAVSTGRFKPGPDTCVVAEGLDAVLRPGHEGIGWLAQRGWVPLGYLGDSVKSAASFRMIEGARHAVPGDRARHLPDGTIELLGRDSATINSGGEKIFAEEVEMAIASHPSVADVVVAGRPSDRWGQEVVAIVALAEHSAADAAALIAHAATSIARYKLPKAVLFRRHIERSVAGKADYAWARAQAIATHEGGEADREGRPVV